MAGRSEIEAIYYYKTEWLKDAVGKETHARGVEILGEARQRNLIAAYQVRKVEESFPTDAEERAFLDRLRTFASHRGIGLGRLFGSNKHHFAWLPSRFLLISQNDRWLEVFPCELEGGHVEPEDFLEAFLKGEAWTLGSRRRGKQSSVHERIVKHLAAHPETLESGLRLEDRDVFVSAGFERGSLDLLFRDSAQRFLIVEVKVKSSELDKATGQLRRHQRLFAEMNHIEPARIRIMIACADVPESRFSEFMQGGIECFVVSRPL